MAKSVFYSFHYDHDYWRVQQVMNMGALEGQTILSSQQWEDIKRQGDTAIEKWIKDQMAYKSALVVLVGAQTAQRRWVDYEIRYAWDNYKPVVGIRIHALADSSGKTDTAGANPFTQINLKNGGTLADRVPLYSPSGADSQAVYASIKSNLTAWVDSAVKRS